jgi:hypothetical protein
MSLSVCRFEFPWSGACSGRKGATSREQLQPMNLRREVWAIIYTFLNQVSVPPACAPTVSRISIWAFRSETIYQLVPFGVGEAIFSCEWPHAFPVRALEFGFSRRLRTGLKTLFRLCPRRRILSGSARFCMATVVNYRKNALFHFVVMPQSKREDEPCPGNILLVWR